MSQINNPFLKNSKFGANRKLSGHTEPTEDLSSTFSKLCKLQSLLKDELVTKEECK
ncbi:MAG: hypothetical protein MJ252_10770 [archaeon]|nr:hypothetical protein [archaeon]